MPSFLYPAFLIGAAAAAVPILLHLLRSHQVPELRFSAVRLLVGVRVEHAERRRIRDWLLLALRVAALLLLAVAFARPYVAREAAATGRATIVAIDRSASMSAPGVWDRARAAALAAVERRSGEAVGLLAFDDRPELVVEPTEDRGALRAALDRLSPGIGGTQFAGALSRASAALEEAGAASGGIVLVSDLQGSAAELRGALSRGVALEIADAGAPFDNVALIAARRQGDDVVATVRNDTAAPVRVRVDVRSADGLVAGEAAPELAPGQAAELSISAPGAGELQVALDAADALAADNVRYLPSGETARPRVLIVADADAAFYLSAALDAGAAREFEVAAEAAPRVGAILAREPPDLVVMVSPRGLDRGGRDALGRFVQGGGGLLIVGGAEAADSALAPLLEGAGLEPLAPEAPTYLAAFDVHHPVFQSIAAATAGLTHARFARAWTVREEGWKTLARFAGGGGALLERAAGSGRIALFASDLNRAWNDLPLQPAFVPFVQELARYLAPRADRYEFTPATAPRGTGAQLGFARAGSGRRVAINLDPRESDPARMTPDAFASAIRRTPPAPSGARRHRVEAAEASQGLWRYGLMLMLAALAVEGLLAARPRLV